MKPFIPFLTWVAIVTTRTSAFAPSATTPSVFQKTCSSTVTTSSTTGLVPPACKTTLLHATKEDETSVATSSETVSYKRNWYRTTECDHHLNTVIYPRLGTHGSVGDWYKKGSYITFKDVNMNYRGLGTKSLTFGYIKQDKPTSNNEVLEVRLGGVDGKLLYKDVLLQHKDESWLEPKLISFDIDYDGEDLADITFHTPNGMSGTDFTLHWFELSDKPVLPSYDFYPYLDSNKGDIGKVSGAEAAEAACDADGTCRGFNSNGWFKHTLKPQSQWSKWTDDASKGFYVKSPKAQRDYEHNGLSHLQSIGDEAFTLGKWSGYTDGIRLRCEGFQLDDDVFEYSAILDGTGDTGLVSGGSFCGSRGYARALTGFEIHFKEDETDVKERYSVKYQGALYKAGITEVAEDGEFCGVRDVESGFVSGMKVFVEEKERKLRYRAIKADVVNGDKLKLYPRLGPLGSVGDWYDKKGSHITFKNVNMNFKGLGTKSLTFGYIKQDKPESNNEVLEVRLGGVNGKLLFKEVLEQHRDKSFSEPKLVSFDFDYDGEDHFADITFHTPNGMAGTDFTLHWFELSDKPVM